MKRLRFIGLIAVLFTMLWALEAPAFEDITPEEFKKKVENSGSGVIVLDVREADEVADCRIPKSVHIPLADVDRRVRELDPAKEILVYCAAGVRSARASKILDNAGFKKVRNLKGGIRAWVALGGKTEGPCK